MTLAEAQMDIRRAYVGGGPGALVSALAAAITAGGFAGLYLPEAIPGGTIFAVAAVEAVFAIALTVRAPK